MAGAAQGQNVSLKETPTWAVALVCFFLIFLSLLIEHVLHLITKVSIHLSILHIQIFVLSSLLHIQIFVPSSLLVADKFLLLRGPAAVRQKYLWSTQTHMRTHNQSIKQSHAKTTILRGSASMPTSMEVDRRFLFLIFFSVSLDTSWLI